MNPVKMIKTLYKDIFFNYIDDETELDITFNEFQAWHESCTPESREPLKKFYHKVCKSMWFKILSPLIFNFLKFQAMKYTNNEYLQMLVDKHIEESK